MPYLQSHVIEAIAYDETAHLLMARWRESGRTTVYEDVPQDVYDSLIFAESISAFFHERIEGAYREREASLSAPPLPRRKPF